MEETNEKKHSEPAARKPNDSGKRDCSWPLVSCIMPTAGRPSCVAAAVQMFLMQDYPTKELIIVYNHDSDLPSIYYPPNVKLIWSKRRIIGGKRNEACSYASGDIIAQWDDDDLYNTNRLSLQVMPLLKGEAHITGLNNFVFYETPMGTGWKASRNLFLEIYVGNVHGGSLVFLRQLWGQVAAYPNISMAEDAVFLRKVLKAGARLKAIDGNDAFVYMRHSSNTWKFENNNFRRYSGWLKVVVPTWALPLATWYTQQNLSAGRQAKRQLKTA